MKNLKNIVITLVTLLPFTVFAATPMRFDGLFGYDGVTLIHARDVEVVRSNDRTKINILMSQGFQCQLQGPVYKCSKHLHDVVIPEEMVNELNHSYKDFTVEIKKSAQDPILTNDADYVKEWDIGDQVTIGNSVTNVYHYYLLDQNIHKFSVSFDSNKFWFIASDSKNFYTPIQKSLGFPNSNRTRYFEIAINLTKI